MDFSAFLVLACTATLLGAPACSGETETTGSGGSGGQNSSSATGGAGGAGGTGGVGGSGGSLPCTPTQDLELLKEGLESPQRQDYMGGADGGLAHITYWTIQADTLAEPEKTKAKKMQESLLHSAMLPPKDDIAGTEIIGTLAVMGTSGERRQELVLKVPANWNGALVVAGTPATRSEFSNEGTMVPWLLRRGYAYVSGNKGMTNGGADGNATLLNQMHPSQHWGTMMIDLAEWAKARLEKAMGSDAQCPVTVKKIYAIGLSNGGYQVRRALEIDHLRVKNGEERLFSGGLDWAGAYFPDARVLDANNDQTVTPAEYAAAVHLVSSSDNAALTMGWAYDAATQTTPAHFAETPPYSAVQGAMTSLGFSPESAYMWGAYNTAFDSFKQAFPSFKGIGYYNFVAYYFRAELLGHDAAQSQAYSPFAGMVDPPPFYTWPGRGVDGGWTAESVSWALKNANTAEFSVPLVTVHGDRDGLIGLPGNAQAYKDAVDKYGSPDLYRLYVIQNGGHVDLHSDGTNLDFNFDGTTGEEGMADVFTLMQPYTERAFDYLVDWAEQGNAPPASKTVTTDPKNDVLDASLISF